MHLYSYDTLLLPITHSGHRPNYHSGQPWTTSWFQSDRQYLYQANLKRLAPDWYYRDHEVTYTWNSTGYRAPEFDTVAWDDSWVIMGGSDVLGVGLAYEDTLGEQISLLLDAPVVNLGVGGSSVNVMQYNTALMVDRHKRPRGVIIVAPPLERLTYWGKREPGHLVATDVDNAHIPTHQRTMIKSWLYEHPHAEMQGHLALRAVRAEWQAQGVPCHIFSNIIQQDPGLEMGPRLPSGQDMARDVEQHDGGWHAHPGRNTMRSWARFIVNQMSQPYL